MMRIKIFAVMMKRFQESNRGAISRRPSKTYDDFFLTSARAYDYRRRYEGVGSVLRCSAPLGSDARVSQVPKQVH